jgi:LacI family transcriptional regulator, fructose operon transcriptional repressor
MSQASHEFEWSPSMQPRKTTIYDIAQRSGASPSTVSAVLNGTWSKRRISAKTVEHVSRIAAEIGYAINMQARGLRQARSGLVGMIIPMHDHRFFSSLGQEFDTQARNRGFCPVIASTLRSPAEEKRIVETLISYAIDALFIAGATDLDQLGAICAAANLRHVYVDLPGRDAPSVVTDNFKGAQQLTRKIIGEMPRHLNGARAKAYFLGGSDHDFATAHRVEAFRKTASETGEPVGPDQILQCGYSPRAAAEAISQLCDRLGGLPAGLFVNSLTAFQGVMSHFVRLPTEAFSDSAIGCFDYDPFASFLQFPVFMIRQDSNQLIAKAYELLDSGETSSVVIEVEPELIEPRTLARQSYSDLG